MNRYAFDAAQHIHTLDGTPLMGTSTVMSVVAKPLTWWAAGQALTGLGWTATKTPAATRLATATAALETVRGLDPVDYLATLDRCYRAHDTVKQTAAEAGTDLHAQLEAYVRHCLTEAHGHPQAGPVPERIVPFQSWCLDKVQRFLWTELHTYSERLWCGGITDCGVVLRDGGIGVVDFKSSKDAYPAHFWQIAGYDLELTESGGFDADGHQTFTLPGPITHHIVVPFGAPDPSPVVRHTVQHHRKAFEAAVCLHASLHVLEYDLTRPTRRRKTSSREAVTA